jgi:hypothetical protein
MEYCRVIVAVSLVVLARGDLMPSNLLRQKVEEVSGQWRKTMYAAGHFRSPKCRKIANILFHFSL